MRMQELNVPTFTERATYIFIDLLIVFVHSCHEVLGYCMNAFEHHNLPQKN